MEEVNKLIDTITKDSKKQTGRYNVVREAAKSWFEHQKELTMGESETEKIKSEPELGEKTF